MPRAEKVPPTVLLKEYDDVAKWYEGNGLQNREHGFDPHHRLYVPLVQWIEQGASNALIRVRFL